MKNFELVILSRDLARAILATSISQTGITHVISIGGTSAVGRPQPAPSGLNTYPAQKLRLTFDDISRPRAGYRMASSDDVKKIINFADELKKDIAVRPCKLMAHCEQGLSRSPAAALIVLCAVLGPAHEEEAMDIVLRAAKTAKPNEHMVTLADQMLKRNGALRQQAYLALSSGMYKS